MHLGYKFDLGHGSWIELSVLAQNLFDTDEREASGSVIRGIFADASRSSPYDFDPPREPIDVAEEGERHRRVIMGVIRGAY